MASKAGLDGGSGNSDRTVETINCSLLAVASPSVDIPPSYDSPQAGKETNSLQASLVVPVAQQSPLMSPSPVSLSPHHTTCYPQGYTPQLRASPVSDMVQPTIQYVVSTPYPMIANPPEPAYPAPHYFIIYVLVAAIICGFLNPLSLTLSVAALVCMTMAGNSSSIGQYPKASKLGTAAFVLTNLTVVFTLLLWVSLIGVIVGYNDGANSCRYVSYSTTPGYDGNPGYNVRCYIY